MDISILWLFAISATILTLIPGPDMLRALSNAMSQGAKAGLITVLGAVTGVMFHILFAIAGVTALIYSSAVLYKSFVIVGALYILWVGVGIFINNNPLSIENTKSKKSYKKLYSEGLLTNLLNPKAIIFTLAFIPQFIQIEAGRVTLQMLILGVELIIIMLLIQIPLVFLAEKIAVNVRANSKIGIYINRFFGVIIVFLGLMVLVKGSVIGRGGSGGSATSSEISTKYNYAIQGAPGGGDATFSSVLTDVPILRPPVSY